MPSNGRKYKKQTKPRRSTATVKKNSRAIKALVKNQYKRCQYYTESLSDDMPNQNIVQLVNPSIWEQLFASNNNNEIGDRFFIDYMKLQFNVTVNNSGILTVSPIHYCIFVVSLNKEYAKSTYNRTNAMTSLTETVDFHSTSLGQTIASAQWVLNPIIYKIHAKRKGIVGNFANEGIFATPGASTVAAQPVSDIRDANKMHMVNMPWRRQLKRGVGEIGGTKTDWKDMTLTNVEAHDQLFVISFNNAGETQSMAQHFGCTVYGKEPI